MTEHKLAFMEALPTLGGLVTGYGPGRSVAGETAAALAPEGRVHRSENAARNLAVIGAPVGGLMAMGLARKHNLAPRIARAAADKFPAGLIAEPAAEQELIHHGVPGVAAVLGSLSGGAASGGLVGGLQRLRGPLGRDKEAALKPSPMWGTVAGSASKPAWRSQAGFTPTGMKTPAQRLQRSMQMGKHDPNKGLKPIDLGKLQEAATGIKMGHVMRVLTPDLGARLDPGEREDAEFGDELEPQIAKAAASPEEVIQKTQRDREQAKAQGYGLGAGAAGYGSKQLVESAAEGITGRTKLYHGTAPDNMQAILEKGVRPATHGGSKGITDIFEGDLASKSKSLGFLTRDKSEARGYADQAEKLKGFFQKNPGASPIDVRMEAGNIQLSPEHIRRKLNPFSNRGVLQASVPLWKTEIANQVRENPEAEHLLKQMEDPLFRMFNPQLTERSIKKQFSDSVVALEGGLDPKYLKGSQNYQRLGLQELGDYIRKHPARFAKGVGAGIAGVGLGGAGLYAGKQSLNHAAQAKALEPVKTAEDGMVHSGFTVSQYSGPLNPPKLPYASGIPSWKEPPLKKTAMPGITPLSRLNKSRSVGAPRVTPAPGPSIAQIAKPKGFGQPMSGAKKGNNTI